MKHSISAVLLPSLEFARQRWRAWIETILKRAVLMSAPVRPSAMAGVD